MTTTPEEINVCQDCHERRGRPPVIDYPTNPFIMCHDCNADTDLLAIETPTRDRHGGIWGDDETCEQCTDDDGHPTPTTHQENKPMTTQPATITQDNLTEFLIGYRDAAHWTGTAWDMSDENGYDDADLIDTIPGHEDPDDLPATVAAQIMTEALNTFATLAHHDHGHTLATYATKRDRTHETGHDGWNLTGHDAYLSAAGHGTGLWDRGIPQGTDLDHTLTRNAQTLTLDTATDTYYYE